MEISVVVLTWNSEQYIHNCLDSLCSDLRATPVSHEVFVVDNGSRDGTVQIIRGFAERYPENIIPIYLENNEGTTVPRNLALRKAKGRFIAVMDSDVEVRRGALGQLMEALTENEETGLVAPRLVHSNGELQKSTDRFPTLFTKLSRYFFLRSIEKREEERSLGTEPREVDYAISAVWMLKREVLEEVGLLDESMFFAPEDADYCLRVWKAGYKVVYTPDVSCIHHAQEISRGLKIDSGTIEHVRGLSYYFRKHRYLFSGPSVR